MHGTVERLFHYPVKGLSAQPLESVSLTPGQGFPLDRIFGFARPKSGFDPQAPLPLPKSKFIMLAKDAALAELQTSYDQNTQSLTIAASDARGSFDIGTDQGRSDAVELMSSHLGLAEEDRPTLYSAAPHRFTDVSVVSSNLMNSISLINLDSVAELSSKIGKDVDPARFRGNLLFCGIPAFAELDWVGRTIKAGEVELKVVRRTKRCPATTVNPETAQRDLDIPILLRDHYGHSDLGIYCEVMTTGQVQPDDTLTLI